MMTYHTGVFVDGKLRMENRYVHYLLKLQELNLARMMFMKFHPVASPI